MTGSIVRTLALLCTLLVQYGCAAKLYSLESRESLSEGAFSPTKIYARSRLPGGWRSPLKVSGVEMKTYLFNSKTVREDDISFIVPIPLKIPEGTGIGHIGRRPFNIILSMRAEHDSATFNPTGTLLYMETLPAPISSTEVLLGKKVPEDCAYGNPPTSAVDKVDKPVPIPSKVPGVTRAEESTHAICLYFLFDVATPDPSETFHLKLGEIITPSGESIRPMIYFSPVNVVEITH